MSDVRLLLAEDWKPGLRLGRHVRHDPRSLQYLVPEFDGQAETKVWERKIPVLDQGSLGSCTGNATVGVLGSAPYYDTLPAAVQSQLNEDYAVKVYSAATKIDDADGTYPPDDTGSDGLSVAKVAQSLRLISGYQHITSTAAAMTAIQSGPFIVGTNWLSGMDSPDSTGLVHVKGSIRGGHEYQCLGYHSDTDTWEFVNSWGTSWGTDGHFFYSTADFAKLLKNQGDATPFVPLTQPAPTPSPTPVPPGGQSAFPLTLVQPWLNGHHYTKKERTAVDAIEKWLNAA